MRRRFSATAVKKFCRGKNEPCRNNPTPQTVHSLLSHQFSELISTSVKIEQPVEKRLDPKKEILGRKSVNQLRELVVKSTESRQSLLYFQIDASLRIWRLKSALL
jgi:hypothetical protein